VSQFLKEALAEWQADPKNSGKELDREGILALRPELDYGPGRTKQSFKDSTDINKILAKAQVTGSLSHFEKHGAFYGDFADMPTDPFEAREVLARGQAIFADAPSEVRAEFRNDPLAFFAFVNDPANSGRLEELLPAIAQRGKYFPDVSPSSPPDALLGASREPQANVSEAPAAPPSGGGSDAPPASEGG
jgi:phage internal scaffolding protein